MKDPLAPDTPYEHFKASMDDNPDEIEEEFDCFIINSPGREMEAVEMWDELRLPKKRLMLDLLQYQGCLETETVTFDLKVPEIDPDDIAKLEKLIIIDLGKSIKLEKNRPFLDMDFERKES